MTWLLPAVVAHLGNALVFVVDKSLLSSKQVIAQPLSYALYSAITAAAVVVALPFFYTPLSSFVLMMGIVAALLRLLALWGFFSALRLEESSRVVPLTGSLVAVLTIPLSLIVGEQLTAWQLVAIVLLIMGGALLSVKWQRGRIVAMPAVGVILVASMCFAANFVISKYVYDHSPDFASSFIYLRLIEAAVALMGLVIVWFAVQPAKHQRRASHRLAAGTVLIFLANKILAAAAFALQHYAISLGSVSVINALQGLQYVFLLGLVVIASRWLPKVVREELPPLVLWQKVVGVLCCALGVGCLL